MVKHHIRGSCLQDNLDRIKDFHHESYAEAIRGDRGSILRNEHLFRTQCRQETKLPAHVSAVSIRLSENPVSCHRTPWCWDPGSGQAAASDTPASPPPVHHRISFREYTVSSYHVRPQKTHSDEHTSPGP